MSPISVGKSVNITDIFNIARIPLSMRYIIMQYYFWDKFILYLFMLPDIYFTDHHCKTSVRNFWNLYKWLNSCTLLQDVLTLTTEAHCKNNFWERLLFGTEHEISLILIFKSLDLRGDLQFWQRIYTTYNWISSKQLCNILTPLLTFLGAFLLLIVSILNHILTVQFRILKRSQVCSPFNESCITLT